MGVHPIGIGVFIGVGLYIAVGCIPAARIGLVVRPTARVGAGAVINLGFTASTGTVTKEGWRCA
jgi:hypothetical protein